MYFVTTFILLVTYLLEVDETETLKIKEDENSGVKWVKFEDVPNMSEEKWMVENVYNKIIEKVKEKKQNA